MHRWHCALQTPVSPRRGNAEFRDLFKGKHGLRGMVGIQHPWLKAFSPAAYANTAYQNSMCI